MDFSRTATRTTAALLLACACATFSAGTAVGQDAVPNSAIAGGGGTVSAGNIRLHYTIGEAAADSRSAGNTTLHSGFQATFVAQGDAGPCSIFCDGFEQ
jgi:hypothetical protein